MQAALTLQTNPNYFPDDSATFIDPTGREFRTGFSTIPTWNAKLNGSYSFPWDINASANFNGIEKARAGRRRSTEPGAVYGGVSSSGAATTINKTTLELETRGATRLDPVNLLDLGMSKKVKLGGPGRSGSCSTPSISST